MRARVTTALLTIAAGTVGGALTLPLPASAAGASCHGTPATHVGTAGDDRLTRDEIVSLGEDPVLTLGAGDDRVVLRYADPTGQVTVCGGGGRDVVVAHEASGAGSYTLDGGPGPDRLGYDEDVDHPDLGMMTLIGRSGDDTLIGSRLADRLVGGTGDDLVLALDGDDRVAGGDGADSLFGHAGADRLLGGAGEDRIEAGGGHDSVDGGAGADSCIAESPLDCEG